MLNIYLAGEIHTNWREEIISLSSNKKLQLNFLSPVTNHDASDNCGVNILGNEQDQFWKDHKGAKINAIRTRKAILDCDIIIT